MRLPSAYEDLSSGEDEGALFGEEVEDDQDDDSEATEVSGESRQGQNHRDIQLGDEDYQIMAVVNSEKALDDLNVDWDRDDWNEDHPGT